MLTMPPKKQLFYGDRLSKPMVNAISSILDGDNAVFSAAGYHSNGFAGVTAQGEQKGIELLVLGIDLCDAVFLPQLCSHQVHGITSD
jgi:hypothetical protein